MKEYIERNALIAELKHDLYNDVNMYSSHTEKEIRDDKIYFAIDALESAPVADVKEVIHGEWKVDSYTAKYGNPYRCSECREEHADTYQYCPNCGAKMDLE